MALINFGLITKRATKWTTTCGVLAVTALLVQGCDQQRSAAGGTRLYAIDQTGGAKTCNSPTAEPASGKTTEIAMTVTNDGGWCGLSVAQSGRPYSAGLLPTRPKDGKVYVHTVGDQTRIDYTPDRGFVGKDSFVVKLVPGNAMLQVNVAVSK